MIKPADRIFKIKNTLTSFHIDIRETKLTKEYRKIIKKITKESFSPWVNWQVVRNYFNDQFNGKEYLIRKEIFCKHFSRCAQNKRNRIIKKLFIDDANIKRDFAPNRNSSMFTTEDKIPSFLKSMVFFFFFLCECSNACYTDETWKHFLTRMKEHLKRYKKSVTHIPIFLIKWEPFQ